MLEKSRDLAVVDLLSAQQPKHHQLAMPDSFLLAWPNCNVAKSALCEWEMCRPHQESDHGCSR